ncbi:MAG: hypothetical protein JO326_14940 [Acetobacteraceae bacterium]|nr:hypothetical protein [Acetobacteraceae bacterium]
MELDPEHAGDPAPAMAAYEALAASADRHSSSYAAYRLIELRLRRGELTPIAAADAMERRLFSWRSERTEPDRRSRIAALRREGGDYRGAIGQLREVASLWPDRSAATKAEMARIFGEAIKSDAAKPMPAIEFVALVEDNPDLVPPGDEGRDIASHVAERLVTLELPRQAIATLAKILAATGPGAARAETGTRLAELNLQEHDPRAALGALDASEAEGLPHDLADRRALARAHAFAALGDPRAALEALATTDTRQGLEFRATLLEQMKDWPNAIAALTEVTGTDVPERGELNDEQARLLLRLASDAAQAGDAATMDRLRARDVPRVRSEAIKGMLSLLTSSPVRARADLPAVGAQEELIRRMPGSLEALNASRSPVR